MKERSLHRKRQSRAMKRIWADPERRAHIVAAQLRRHELLRKALAAYKATQPADADVAKG